MKIAILFDLDGTLLDTAPDFTYAINRLRAESGYSPLDCSTIKPHVTAGITAFVSLALGYTPEHPDFNNQASRLLSFYQECLGHYTEYFPGTLELLQLCEEHNIPWGVVTNKQQQYTDPLLKKLNLSHKAHCIVSGDTTPFLKPHPQPLLHASELIGIPAKQCIFIGDAKTDVQAGNAAGMTTIAALYGYIPTIEEALQWRAHHHVQHTNEIWPLIKGFGNS